mmetsp:Transcript_133691/g.231894  ORF Transcript_133691/g.231894 Transcript_133691/m.231894 type:complete len:205 (-) Transcript_133691:1192-1806(-)
MALPTGDLRLNRRLVLRVLGYGEVLVLKRLGQDRRTGLPHGDPRKCSGFCAVVLRVQEEEVRQELQEQTQGHAQLRLLRPVLVPYAEEHVPALLQDVHHWRRFQLLPHKVGCGVVRDRAGLVGRFGLGDPFVLQLQSQEGHLDRGLVDRVLHVQLVALERGARGRTGRALPGGAPRSDVLLPDDQREVGGGAVVGGARHLPLHR